MTAPVRTADPTSSTVDLLATGITTTARVVSLTPIGSESSRPNRLGGRPCDIVLAIDNDDRNDADGLRSVRAPLLVRLTQRIADVYIDRYSTGVARVRIKVDADDPDRVIIDSSSLTSRLRIVSNPPARPASGLPAR